MAALLSGGVFAQIPAADPPSTDPPDQQVTDLQFLASILQNPANDAETRRGAAARLLAMEYPPAIDVLDAALRRGDDAELLAVLKAMNARAVPVPGLLEAALAALGVAGGPTLDQLALALAKYEAPALVRVAAIAQNPAADRAERLAAIHALGAFPTQESGDRLIGLADPNRGEDPMIRTAALRSLRRLAPVDLGPEFDAWARWWRGVRDKSPAEWARELVRQYQDRTAEMERANAALVSRYVELLRELYRSLPVDPDQLARMPQDLEDPIEPVRALAMSRIERLLRDSVIISDAVQERLRGCLDDPAPELRRRSAQLLDELGDADLADAIVERLPDEHHPDVVRGYLAILARAPAADALPTIINVLRDGNLVGPAADCLWSHNRQHPLAAEERRAVQTILREAETRLAAAAPETPAPSTNGGPNPRASVLRLLALLGSDDDRVRMEQMLDDADPTLRRAVAEGLAGRGATQALLARADDEAIYPVVLRLVADGPAELDQFELLVNLRPHDAMRDEWAESVRRFATRLDPARLIAADQMLANQPYADVGLRTIILTPVAVTPPPELSIDYCVALVVRLTPLLIEQGDALRAFEIIDALGAEPATYPALNQARFAAALDAGRFEDAALAEPDPVAWIARLETLSVRDPDHAVRVRDEITRRFPDLPESARRALEAASANLPATPADGETNDDEPLR
ncbi:MAG: hypothetical protein HKO59_01390 [Phycisphaerales bacterium]|nr:hypothetical protein [Phycisphaerales bacterium]